MFVFQGKHRAVLISYPEEQALRAAFSSVAPTAPTDED